MGGVVGHGWCSFEGERIGARGLVVRGLGAATGWGGRSRTGDGEGDRGPGHGGQPQIEAPLRRGRWGSGRGCTASGCSGVFVWRGSSSSRRRHSTTCAPEAAHVHGDVDGVARMSVDEEEGDGTAVLVLWPRSTVSTSPWRVVSCVAPLGLDAKCGATGEASGLRERVEDRLAPGRAGLLRADEPDDVDELSLTGDLDPVGMPQEGVEEAPDEDGVRDGEGVLDEGGVCSRSRFCAHEVVLVPDVPLVEGEVDPLQAAALGSDVVDGGDGGADELVHLDGGGEEAREVAILSS